MVKKIVCFEVDPQRLRRLCDAVIAAGGEPVEAGRGTAARLARAAQAVVAAGVEGLDLLARLAIDKPHLPRVALIPPGLSAAELLALVERVHPWELVSDDAPAARLEAALRDALQASTEGLPLGEQTQRIVRPSPQPSFERLVEDALTGTDTYHYLRLRLDEELERASRYARPLSLLLLDVDDLRGINDRWGRPVGDFVLKQVAATLQAGARSTDRVGRWAGGAFAVVLPETAAGAALSIAERLRSDVAARRFGDPASGGDWQRMPARLRFSVSCGVASTLRDGASRPQSLIARTDYALLRAKQGGRNRSVVDG